MKKTLFLALLALALLSSCSPRLSPFTKTLYESHGWGEGELRRIQFYLSEDIVLQRPIGRGTKGGTEIISGKIRMINGREVEEVIIRAGTPGVLVELPERDEFIISFEEGNDRVLRFGLNAQRNNYYTLMGKNLATGSGTVFYDGKEYNLIGSSRNAALFVDLRKIIDNRTRSRTASGRRIE